MMKMIKLSQVRHIAAVVGLVVLVTVSGSAALASYVSQVMKINYAVTDDVVAGIYLLALLLVYQLGSWLVPRRRRRGRRGCRT